MGASIAAQGLPRCLLAKERIVAGPGFSQWLVPPAALTIYSCIGVAHVFSVIGLPLSKALGIQEALTCGPEVGFWGQPIRQTRLQSDTHAAYGARWRAVLQHPSQCWCGQ